MSDNNNPFGFGSIVPGFDFLKNLVDSASKGSGGAQVPGLSSWVAPTMNIEELDRRIGELKAVRFWLEQNGKALAATIQALEVQKMTLSTLKGMNFAMGDVANAFKIKPEDMPAGKTRDSDSDQKSASEAARTYAKSFETAPPPAPPESTPAAVSDAAKQRATAANDDAAEARATAPGAASAGSAGVVDPMQWWGALTSQFQQIAANAMKDSGSNPALDATRAMTNSALKATNEMTASMAGGARKTAAAKPASAKKSSAAKTPRKAAKKAGARKSAAKSPPAGQ